VSDRLNIAAVRITNTEGHIFVVRKKGTSKWMQPGGKLEPGESPERAALRELNEEMGLSWTPDRLTPLGNWEGPAANEADTRLTAHLFAAEWVRGVDGHSNATTSRRCCANAFCPRCSEGESQGLQAAWGYR
jgi:8-oxo-dGTP pyrophosphatase MutT (NUDIX family)